MTASPTRPTIALLTYNGSEVAQMVGEALVETAVTPELVSLAERAGATGVKLLEDAVPNGLMAKLRFGPDAAELQRVLAQRVSNSLLYNWEPLDIIKNLDIQPSELNTSGFNVLDVGAGGQILARKIDSVGWLSKIFSVEPRLALSQSAENAFARTPKDLSFLRPAHPLAVAALADNLPFADQSFDRVFAHFSVPFYLDDATEMRNTANEMMRVLKSGGISKLSPLTRRHRAFVATIQSLANDVQLTSVGSVASSTYGPEQGWRLMVTKPLF